MTLSAFHGFRLATDRTSTGLTGTQPVVFLRSDPEISAQIVGARMRAIALLPVAYALLAGFAMAFAVTLLPLADLLGMRRSISSTRRISARFALILAFVERIGVLGFLALCTGFPFLHPFLRPESLLGRIEPLRDAGHLLSKSG